MMNSQIRQRVQLVFKPLADPAMSTLANTDHALQA